MQVGGAVCAWGNGRLHMRGWRGQGCLSRQTTPCSLTLGPKANQAQKAPHCSHVATLGSEAPALSHTLHLAACVCCRGCRLTMRSASMQPHLQLGHLVCLPPALCYQVHFTLTQLGHLSVRVRNLRTSKACTQALNEPHITSPCAAAPPADE